MNTETQCQHQDGLLRSTGAPGADERDSYCFGCGALTAIPYAGVHFAQQIRDLRVGDEVELCFDGKGLHYYATPAAARADESRRWGKPLTVTEITFSGVSVKGQPYVGVRGRYEYDAPGSSTSFAIGTDATHIRITTKGGR